MIMDGKFLVILLATIFYNGVTHSSPVDVQRTSDVGKVEEKSAGVPAAVGPNNGKEQTPASTEKPSIPVSPKTAQQANAVANKNETTQSIPQSVPVVPHKVVAENATQNATNKIDTQIIDKNNSSSSETKANQMTDGKSSDQGTSSKDAVQPMNETMPANGNANKTDIPTVTPDGKNSVVSTTSIVPTQPATNIVPSKNTMSSSTIKPTTPTVAPTSTSKDNVISGQNTPALVQEKHFDGASFVGGIVLTIGLTAIGFIAFKYYKSGKIDMSYRTL